MKVLLLILISLSCFGQTKRDAYHVYAGAGISIVSAEITHQLTNKPGLSALVGFGLGTLAGMGKEIIWDRALDKGVYSKKDMFLTSWGSAIGALCIRVKFDINYKKQSKCHQLQYNQ